jgi:hypothetical protein|tara:strand:- start:196 stop:327 length:132 start_codon:yes stop_codon:yes gene_type:complete
MKMIPPPNPNGEKIIAVEKIRINAKIVFGSIKSPLFVFMKVLL